MKEHRIIPVNKINLTVVITVMIFVAILTQGVIKELTIRDIMNVTRLTHTNIFAEIKQEMMDPINTSLIMANNTLLLDFMDGDTVETEEKMAEYLTAIQKATGYESVFIVPHSTLSYYHPGGTDAKVDLESDHAYWYTNRIDAKDAYGFVVNTENLDNWALTIYVDANINDRDGNFVGLAGVGKRLTHLQEILTGYLDDQGVEGYIIDANGEIKVHQNEEYIKNKNFYDLENISENELDIKESHKKPVEVMIDNKFLVVQHIPKLDWYLVVRKSASDLTVALSKYSRKVIATLGIGAIIILLVTKNTVTRYKRQIISLSNIDHLTDISNRTIFEHALQDAVENINRKKFSLVLFDLDNLKMINDNLGHDMGDMALKIIGQLAKEKFKSPNLVSRVGGDEFAVIIYKSVDEVKELMEDFKYTISINNRLKEMKATVSIGITEAVNYDRASEIYKRADEAMYQSKNNGKNKITRK